MASDEEFEALKGRITELENRLAAGRGEEPAPVTRDELAAFVKVQGALADRISRGGFGAFTYCWPSFKPEDEELAAFLGMAPGVNPDDEGGADRIGGLGE